ncbi:MAG: alkaline phosphatase D family protein [Actinomycetales bacterium]
MSNQRPEPATLVLGPLLRYVGTTTATVWVKTSAPATVEVLGHRAQTFTVHGHHYALVVIEDLTPGTVTPYDVRLGDRRVWPVDGARPQCAIHTRHHERRARLVFGSCRVMAPSVPPYTLPPDQHKEGMGVDALWAYARRLQGGQADWPDALVLLGDQMYVDEVSPGTLEFIRSRRDVRQPPGEAVADFEEYTQLYAESWSDPEIRWLLSTVPSTMIFDDHEVQDDWNISSAWVEDVRRLTWWDDRVTAAFSAYWIYQHIGNLAPPELAEEVMFRRVFEHEDAGSMLRERARQWDRESAQSRWAYYRDFGRSRVLVVDSRAARVLTDGRRAMVDEGEWAWITDHARGDFDHLVIVSTLPMFLPWGIHHLEAWNEAVCEGRWGRLAARLGEKIRRAGDLEHWAAFNHSFEQMLDLLRDVAAGRGGAAPASVVLLSGDVHTTYAVEVDLDAPDVSGRVVQVACSPFRNQMPPHQRRVVRAAGSRLAGAVFGRLARWAGVAPPTASWRYIEQRTFDNAIGELRLDGSSATVQLFRATAAGGGSLEPIRQLTIS